MGLLPGAAFSGDLDGRAAAHFCIHDFFEHAWQIRKIDRAYDALELARLQIAAQALPDFLAQRHRRVDRIHAQQADSAQDEWHYRGIETVARRQTDARECATDLHGAGKPCQDAAAEIVDRTGPGCLVERLYPGEIEASA